MSSTLDISKYNKLKFDDIKEDLELMKDEKNVTRTNINKWFSNQSIRDNDGKIKIIPAKFRATDYFDLPKGFLVNQPNNQPNTTIGSYLFNAFILCNAFENGKVAYYDKEMNSDNFSSFCNNLASSILHGTVSVQEFNKFSSMLLWLCYFTELFMPGLTLNMIVPNKELMNYKKELLNENKDLLSKKIYNSDDVSEFSKNVEKPLVKKAIELLQDDPGMRLYKLSKPSFGNNYKNSNIVNGPVMDPISGKYKINTKSYTEGITKESFSILANKSLTSTFSRAVATQDGGAMTKYLSVAMQNIKTGPKDSECGTKGYVTFKVDETHWPALLYDFMIEDDGSLTLLTPEIKNKVMGKTIKLRSPLYCKAKDYYCNHCIGDRYYRMGIQNIGLASIATTGYITNKNMKAMHDISIKTFKMNFSELINFEK